MKELALKYGCNPNQKPSRIYMDDGELPIEVVNGRPGYINFLDALNSWQLVKEPQGCHGSVCRCQFQACVAGRSGRGSAFERYIEEGLLCR